MTDERNERQDPRSDEGAGRESAEREAGVGVSDDPEAGGPGNGEAGDGGGEVAELRDALDSLNDRHLRLAAEFDNYRKRNERDRQVLAVRLQADLVSALLDVLDDLQRVERAESGATVESVVEGVRLVERKFIGVLEGAGLERMDVEGQPFNPETMEALMTVPTGDPAQDDHVADVFQPGYRFRDVLVRPARVRVWKYEGSESQSE